MKTLTRWSLKVRFCFVVVCLPAVGSSPLCAAWGTTQFEVVQGEPGSLIDALAEGIGLTDLDDEVVAEIELYLSQVAAEYERLGFAEPAIDDKLQGGFAYKIFVWNYDSDENGYPPAARYAFACGGTSSRRYIMVDSSRLMKGSAIDPEMYRNMAHELFHAVQGGYDLFHDNCDLGSWIVEGTADAIGIDTALKLRKIKLESEQTRWGGRLYSTPLRVGRSERARRDEGYWTASLWRYLGEHQRASSGDGRAGTKEQPADYRYLAALFERGLAGRAGVDSELRWLDEGLDEITGLGLGRLYPNFVSTFVGYVPDRAGTPDIVQGWRQVVFGGCPGVSLSTAKAEGTVRQELDRVTAGCFEVSSSIPDRVDVVIHARGLDRAGLESLWIGTAKGTKVAPPTIVEVPAGSGNLLGHWLFRIPTDEPQIFVVSNVAPHAADTRPRTADLHVSMPSWDSSLTKAEGQAQQTLRERRATGDDRPDPTAKRTAEELETGLNALSAHVAAGGTLDRRPAEGGCVDPFVFQACGPMTTIGLSLLPGSFGQLGYVSGTGGQLSQMLAMFGGIAEAGAGELTTDWFEAGKLVDSRDGSEVWMIIPLIDYGFSGSFDNASLVVSRAGEGLYEAIGPKDALPGQDVGFPLAGRVTIEEYSPLVLRGTFSGGLVDMGQVGILQNPNPTLPIHAQVKGSFHVVAPWQGDDRREIVPSSSDPEQLRQDLAEAFPFLGDQVDELVDEILAGGAGGGRSGGGSGGGVRGGCDCSCNRAEVIEPRCEEVCQATFDACRGEKYALPEKPAAEQAAEAAEIAELRETLEAALRQRFPGDALKEARDSYLQIFDGYETIEQRRGFIDLMGFTP